MTVTYLLRSPGTGHSLEELFGGIRRGMARQPGRTAQAVSLPHLSRGLRSVGQNLLFVARRPWPGLVHLTGDAHYAVLALPASRTVLTIHDCITLETNRNRPLRYALFWLFWFYLPIRRAAGVTTISEKTRQDLLQLVGRVAQKVVVVPNGYDPAFVRHSQPFDTKTPTLLHIGTAPHKNLTRLTEALDDLACTLIIVGPLTQQAVADLAKRRIAYRNYVNPSRAEVVQLYTDCDIVVFVSTYEGFGMPILEANAVGRAVITSDQSPMNTIAGGAAHLVDPTDVPAIRQGILRLIHDDAYRQGLIEAGYWNAQRYTMETVVTQYAALYDRLACNEPLPVPAP